MKKKNSYNDNDEDDDNNKTGITCGDFRTRQHGQITLKLINEKDKLWRGRELPSL